MNTLFPISVSTLPHLEPILAKEMESMGFADIREARRIVHATGDTALLYRANLELRTALRVFVPLQSFSIRHSEDLYKRAMQIKWEDYLQLDQTFAIEPNVHSILFKHPHFASLRLKDAIADIFQKQHGRRPDVNADHPDVLFHLHIDEHRVTISLDSSGESLNRRGYRQSGANAPLNEVLAAAMVSETGWDGETPLYIPMCGSGTLAIEAAMKVLNIPSQSQRERFGFMGWKSFDPEIWQDVRDQSEEKRLDKKLKIYATDVDRRGVEICRKNIQSAELEHYIQVEVADFFELKPASEIGTLLFNPPYGERLQEHEEVTFLYKRLGSQWKHVWEGHTVWMISSNMEAFKAVGLKPSRKLEVMNGPLKCSYRRFDLFRGKREDFVIQRQNSRSH